MPDIRLNGNENAVLVYAEGVLDEDQLNADPSRQGWFTSITLQSKPARRAAAWLARHGYLTRVTVVSPADRTRRINAYRISNKGILWLANALEPMPTYHQLITSELDARARGRGIALLPEHGEE